MGIPLAIMLVAQCHAFSKVAQWLACWAQNPKVRGSKPRSAMNPHVPRPLWVGEGGGGVGAANPIRARRAGRNARQAAFALAGPVRAYCVLDGCR